MPAHQRVLLLGPTGVDKRTAINRLNVLLESRHGQAVTYVDFENDYLKGHLPAPQDWMTFLAQDSSQQHNLWKRAWTDFKRSRKVGITVLGLHGCYISNVVGLRSAIDIPAICKDFKPTLIVSLIDDVYEMWAKTEGRAGGMDNKGRPTFEQLLVARRAEQFIGDIILTHLGIPSVRHVVCACGNTLVALGNLVIRDAPLTYLSFPISAPRQLAAAGDLSFVNVINDAHAAALARMRSDSGRSFISPLSIDELPLLKARDEGGSDSQFEFGRSTLRWPLHALWGDADALILPRRTDRLLIPRDEVDNAEGTITTDVGWRDRRLVLQSHSLAIVCPKPPNENRVTRGVLEEVTTAVPRGIVCTWWQKPEWDPQDFVGGFWPAAGSMGIGQTQSLVRRAPTLHDLISSGA